MTISPDQLQTAIEGRLVAVPGDGEVARLVRLAGRLDRLRPAGPSAAQTARMSAQFEQVMAGGPRRRAFAVPPPWGERTRTPLIQRFAAGALLFAAVGGGA